MIFIFIFSKIIGEFFNFSQRKETSLRISLFERGKNEKFLFDFEGKNEFPGENEMKEDKDNSLRNLRGLSDIRVDSKLFNFNSPMLNTTINSSNTLLEKEKTLIITIIKTILLKEKNYNNQNLLEKIKFFVFVYTLKLKNLAKYFDEEKIKSLNSYSVSLLMNKMIMTSSKNPLLFVDSLEKRLNFRLCPTIKYKETFSLETIASIQNNHITMYEPIVKSLLNFDDLSAYIFRKCVVRPTNMIFTSNLTILGQSHLTNGAEEFNGKNSVFIGKSVGNRGSLVEVGKAAKIRNIEDIDDEVGKGGCGDDYMYKLRSKLIHIPNISQDITNSSPNNMGIITINKSNKALINSNPNFHNIFTSKIFHSLTKSIVKKIEDNKLQTEFHKLLNCINAERLFSPIFIKNKEKDETFSPLNLGKREVLYEFCSNIEKIFGENATYDGNCERNIFICDLLKLSEDILDNPTPSPLLLSKLSQNSKNFSQNLGKIFSLISHLFPMNKKLSESELFFLRSLLFLLFEYGSVRRINAFCKPFILVPLVNLGKITDIFEDKEVNLRFREEFLEVEREFKRWMGRK